MADEALKAARASATSDGAAGMVGRWAAAHARTVLPPGPGSGSEPGAGTEPSPRAALVSRQAVMSSFTEIGGWPDRPATCLAWGRLSDGREVLATGGDDGTVRILDPGNKLFESIPIGAAGRVLSIAWGTGDAGPLLAITGHGTLDGTMGSACWIWDPRTGDIDEWLVSRTTWSRLPLAWGTDRGGHPVLAMAGGDTLGIWDPVTRQRAAEFSLASDGVPPHVAAWARGPDGRPRLAYGSASDEIDVVDPETGQHLATGTIYDPWAGRRGDTASAYRAISHSLNSMAYALRADGELLLAAADENDAYIWTEADGTLKQKRLDVPSGRGAVRVSWASLADGRMLLACSGGDQVHLWDGSTLERLHTESLEPASGETITALAWTPTPDERLLLATASDNGRVRFWEAVLDPPVGPPATKARLTTSPGRAVPRQPGPARLVLPPEEVTPSFPEAAQIREAPTCLACVTTPDGQILLATANEDADVAQLWDLESGRHLRTLTGHSDVVLDVAWAQKADRQLLLATASGDDTARIWDPETGQELRTLTAHRDEIYAVAWGTRPDGTLLLATGSNDNTVRIWDPETGQELRTLTAHRSTVDMVAWGTRPDGTLLLATSSRDGTARIWDPETGQELRTLTGHSGSVGAVAWGTRPDGTLLLATGSIDNTVRIWDPDTGQELRTLTGPGQEGKPDQERTSVFAAAWARAADGRLLLATAGNNGPARIWDHGTGTELASLPGPRSVWRSAAWTRDRDGNLLLLLANRDLASGPVRAWLVETGTGGQAEPQEPDQPGIRRVAQASRQLLRLGPGGLWLSLGLLTDLVTLTGWGDATLEAGLRDPRLAALADETGITRLRDLAAGQPRWTPDARAAFAALLSGGLDIPARYTPPPDAQPAELRDALDEALTAVPGPASGPGVHAEPGPWRAPVAELRAAASAVDDRMITLLAILGPDACAADPLLPLRLARYAPRLPALSPRELRFLASVSSRRPATGKAALGTMTYSPGTVGVARSGPLTRLLPTQLALPPDLFTTRLAENQLLYRQHRTPAPPAPEPLTIILDTTPPTYGPAGTALRLAAHLITATLWDHGHHPNLITLDNPATATELHAPADLLQIWTSATLDPPGPRLAAARQMAAGLGQPAVLLTHHQTAREAPYVPGPGNRLLTTHQPPEKAPAEPASPWHAHLPPSPAEAQLTAVIGRLLVPSAEDGR